MANSAVVGLLRALLVCDTAEFDKAMKRAEDSAKTWSKALQKTGAEAQAVGRTLTAGLTLPLVGLAAGAAKLAIDFESSFAGVRKTVDATEPELEALSNQFRTLAKTIPISVNEINKLAETAGALGVPKAAIAGFVEVMAGLGVATDLTADDAANAIARIQTIFGAAGKDTDRFASTLVGLGNAGASTEKEIVEMAQRIAGAGHAIGLTQAQVLSLSSAMAGLGINAEAGGSSMSRILTKMNQAMAAGGKELQKWAAAAKVSAKDFAAAFERGPAEALTLVIEGLATAGKNQATVVQGLVGKNTTLLDTFQRLTGAGDNLRKTLELGDEEWRKNTALTNETSKRYATMESQLTILWNRVKDVGITLGQALLPAIKLVTSAFDSALPIIEGMVRAFTALPAPVQLVVFAFGGIVAATGPMLMFFGSMASGLGTLVGAFKKGEDGVSAFGKALSWLKANPMMLVLSGLALLGVAIYAAATAESELEQEVRENTAAFADETRTMEKALAKYTELKDKQKLTKEQTKELDTATRLLAEASGLSADGFKKEFDKSEELNRSLVAQMANRRDLVQHQVEGQRMRLREAQTAVLEVEEARNRILAGRGEIRLTGLAGDAGRTRAMTLDEQAQAELRLRKEIQEKTKTMEHERDLLHAMTGVKREDIALTDARASAKKKEGEAAAGAADEETKAAKRQREEIEKLAAKLTGADVAEEVAKLAAAIEYTQKSGQKVNFAKARKEIDELAAKGASLPPILERVRHQFDITFGPDTGPSLFDQWSRHLGNFQIEIEEVRSDMIDLSALTGALRQDALSAWERDVGTGGITFVPEAFSNWRDFDLFGRARQAEAEKAQTAADKAAAASLAQAEEWAKTFGGMVGGLYDEIGAGLTEMFAEGISGAQSFSDGFVNIWKGIERKLAEIFGQILNLFINGLMRGMIGAAMGQKGAFAQAFAGMGGTGANSLWSTVLGGGATAGGAAAAGGAVPGLAVSTVNTSAVTGGAAASGGLGSAGALGAVGGSVAGAGAGAAVGYYVGYHSGSAAKGAAAGGATGATVGFALGGPIGAGVGGGVGALAGWYGAVKAGKEINNLRDAFAEAQGGMDALEASLRGMGREDLWEPFAHGERNLGAFKEALGKIQEVLEITGARDAFAQTRGGLEALQSQLTALGREDLWKKINDASDPRAMRQAVADMQAVFKATDEVMRKVGVSFGKLTTAASAYGRTVPANLRKAIAPLLESKGITDEMRAGLEALAKDPSWKELEGRAKDLGIDLDALGSKFQNEKLHEVALGYVRDLTMFSDAGADMDRVLEGMSDELSDLYNDAKRHGVALPETLRPYMQRLVDLGLLVDEDGEKIMDLNGITFDPTIEDQPLIDIKNVLIDIKDLLERQLPEAANTAADGINEAFGRIRPPNVTPIGIAVPRPGPGTGPTTPPTEPGEGEDDTGSRVPQAGPGLQGGTYGRYVDWGAGTNVSLHGRERVMREGEAISGGGGAPINITVISKLDGKELARNQVRYIPRELGLAGL